MAVKNIMIVGVGGQGTLLTSRILGGLAIAGGYDVKLSEVHGMAQRGGSVVTYVRYGEKVYSPIIEEGEADIVLAFEQLEAARYLPYLKKDGIVVVNTQKMDPMPVVMGAAEYPHDILDAIRAKGVNLVAVDALSMAVQAGSAKAVNVALIGVMARNMDLEKQVWKDTIAATVPAKFLEMNEKAFELGYASQGE